MKKYGVTTKKQLSTLALGCALIASTALALVNCTDPAPTKYTVSFNMNGGEPAVKDNTVEKGKLLKQPSPDPSKEGYSFAGWYKDKALTQAFNFSADNITANITLYARWVPEGTTVTYTVSFNMNGGEPAVKDNTVEKGKTPAKPSPNPSKAGYSFAGWYKDKDLTQAFDFNADTITANTTLYAKWADEDATETYTVTFNTNGGIPAIANNTVEKGKLLTQPSPDPSKPDSLFVGWYNDQALTQAFDFASDNITANTTLYAKWKSPLVTIPDDDFRARLKRKLPDTVFVGDLLNAKSPAVTGLTILNLRIPSANSIKNLEGIQYFTELEVLDCSENQLTGLDVSNNTKLIQLYCHQNQLTRLDVSNNARLIVLNVSVNQLTGLDVSTNTKLEELQCHSNQLTRLDVSNNTALTALLCVGNQLTYLDIRGMRSVTWLGIHDTTGETNAINTLKVHENLKDDKGINTVKTARGDEVTIETYSAADGSTEYTLLCSDYDPTADREADRCGDELKYTVTFNSNGGSLVDTLYLYHEGLISTPENPTKLGHTLLGWYKDEALTQAFDFNAGTITANTTLYAKWKSHLVDIPDVNFRNKLQALIPGAFVGEKLNTTSDEVTGLQQLDMSTSGTDSIKDLTGIHYFTALTTLNCSNNSLTVLDVSKNTQLTALDCSSNSLTSLDVSNNTALTTLSCGNNSLTGLDVSNNTALTTLSCGYNSLTGLDVSNNTALTTLSCGYNSLTSLDVSSNIQLKELHCSNNELTLLDVSNNTQLTMLSCATNSLTSLDVSNNTKLIELNCIENKLIYLDLRGIRQDISETPIQLFLNPSLASVKVHVNLKDYLSLENLKKSEGDDVTIETYSAAAGSVEYSLVCSDYDPTAGREADRCGDEIKYTVTFNSNGGSLVDSLYLYHEGLISTPANPTKTDSIFVGWYKDAGFAQAFDFATERITADTTLYARWASNKLTKANKHLLSRVDASKKATIMEGVISIGDEAFYGNGLSAVALPNSLTEIGLKVFASNNFTSLVIPNSVTEIGTESFAYNELTSVTIPEGVTWIRGGAFQNNKLTSVTIPEGVTWIKGSAFQNNKLTSVTLPDSLVTIDPSAFSNNDLISVVIPDNVTYIGDGAFEENKLTSVTISKSVMAVGIIAFTANPDLETVTLSEALYNAIVQKTSVNVEIGIKIFSIDHAGLDNTFGSQVATYQTHDGTKLNEDAPDASN